MAGVRGETRNTMPLKTVECYQRLFEYEGQRMVVFDTLGTPGA